MMLQIHDSVWLLFLSSWFSLILDQNMCPALMAFPLLNHHIWPCIINRLLFFISWKLYLHRDLTVNLFFFFFFFLKGWIIQVFIITSWQQLCIPDLGWLEWLFLSFVQSNDLKCSLQWHLEGLYTWRFVISRMSSVCLLCLVCDILQVSHNEMLHFQQMAWQAGKVPRQHFVVVQCTKERMAAHHAVLP